MADVTGRIGDNEVALDNAATEATLRALLLAVSGSTKNMDKLLNLANKAGLDPKAVAAANKGASAFGAAGFAAGKVASVAMAGLSKTAMVLGGVIGDLTASAFKTVGNLTDFAGKLLDGTASASGLFGAFKDLPLGIGLVAGLFEKLALMQEANLSAYRDMSKAGINFGGSLNDIKLQALEMGTTLEGFVSIMKNNSEAFASMGQGANDGAKNFLRFSKELQTSGVGKALSGLGFTLEEMSQGAANYIKFSGGRTAEEMKNTKGLTASAGEYLKQLDMLSGITGKSREEQEKLLAEESANAAFQAHLQSLEPAEREKAMKAFNDALQTGGKGAASYLRSTMMGIPPLDEAGQTFMAMATNGTAALDKVASSVKDQSKSLNDLNGDLAGFRVGLGQDGKAITGPLGASLIASGGAMGEFASKAISTQTQLNNQNIKSTEDEIAFRKKLSAEQAEREKSTAAAAAESEKALKQLGAQLMGSLMPIFEALGPIINNLTQEFSSFVTDNMPEIKSAMKTLATFIGNFAKDIFSDEGQKKIINDITYYFKLMLIEIKKAIVPFYNDKDAAEDKERLELEKATFDRKAETARTEMEIAAKEKKLKDDKVKLTDEQRARMNEEVAALKQTRDAQKKAAGAADNDLKTGKRSTGDTAAEAVSSVDIPMADTGGMFSGPKSGYPVMLHGEEAVIPLGGMGKKNPLEDFIKKLPSMDEIGSKLKDAGSDPMGTFKSLTGSLEQFAQKVSENAKPVVQQAQTGLKGALGDVGLGDEKLVNELQTLNKQTAQMLYYIKESVDFDRRNLDAVRGLNGNLFA